MARAHYHSPILDTIDESRWILVATMWRQLVGAIWLAPRTDLRAALELALERFRRCGWTIETDDLRWGEVYMRRGAARLCVSIGGDPWRAPSAGADDCQTDHLGRSRCPVCKGADAVVAGCPTCRGLGRVKLRNLREIEPAQ